MAGWGELTEELDRWHDFGATATFWWRDDDAVDATTQLAALLEHAGTIPLALAVIPGLATQDLAAELAAHPSVVVLQHGWNYTNHAPDGNSEYPAGRPAEEVSRELADGRRVLSVLFGRRAIPVFAPPWHGFDSRFLPLLRSNGIAGISRKGPRPALFAAESIVQANAHMAPIKWGSSPSFGDEARYLDQAIDHLRGRRLGCFDPTEPTGLLTHHLLQDDKSYAFISRFTAIVSEHPACVWMDATHMFSLRPAVDGTSGSTSGN